MDETTQKVFDCIKGHQEGIGSKDIARELNISVPNVYIRLNKLLEGGLVYKVGEGRNVKYFAKKKEEEKIKEEEEPKEVVKEKNIIDIILKSIADYYASRYYLVGDNDDNYVYAYLIIKSFLDENPLAELDNVELNDVIKIRNYLNKYIKTGMIRYFGKLIEKSELNDEQMKKIDEINQKIKEMLEG